MAFAFALELNMDMVDYLQTKREDEAIQLFEREWSTFDSTWPTEWAATEIALSQWRHRAAVARLPNEPNERAPVLISPCQSRSPSPLLLSTSNDDDNDDGDIVTTPMVFDSAWHFAPVVSTSSSKALIIHSAPTDDFMSPIPLPRNLDNFFTLYSYCFIVESGTNRPITTLAEWRQAILALRVVMSYNAALACHVRAVKTTSVSAFQEALCRYQLTLVRLESQVVCNPPFDTEFDVVLMALLNNIGHCYAALNYMEKATVCFRSLSRLVASSTQANRLDDVERVFFAARLELGTLATQAKPAEAA
jgi:hypothetical protein